MKKVVSIILVAVISLMFSACSTASTDNNDFSGVELVEWGEVNRLKYFDLETIEKSSDVIVIGTFTDDARQEEKYLYDDHFYKDILIDVKSFNTIEVSQVLQGDVQVGDTLTVAQEYGVVDNRLLTYSELTPMMKGDTWIFFLYNNQQSGIYYCSGDSDGRYPVKNCEYARIALTDNEDLGVYDKKSFNEDIYNELLEKYDF